VDNTFIDLIREFEDRPLALQIYNSKSQTLRGKAKACVSNTWHHRLGLTRPDSARASTT